MRGAARSAHKHTPGLPHPPPHQELLGNVSQACTMYEKGAALLQYIVASLGPDDTAVVQKFVDAFGKRIKACKAAEEGQG